MRTVPNTLAASSPAFVFTGGRAAPFFCGAPVDEYENENKNLKLKILVNKKTNKQTQFSH